MISEEDRSFVASEMGDMLDAQAFAAVRQAALVETSRNALASLLAAFDDYCTAHDVRYFLFGDSLRGAVCYEDYIPGSSSIQLGMTFSEYAKLEKSWREDGETCRKGTPPWTMSFPHVGRGGDVTLLPRVRSLQCFTVEHGGRTMFGEDSFPLEIRHPEIELSIFDAVPDDFLVRKSFLRQTRRWSRVISKTATARKLLACRKIPSVANLLHAVIPLRLSVWRLSHCATRYEGLAMEFFSCVRGARSEIAHLGSPEAFKRITFHGMRVWAPADDTPWASYSNPEMDEQLREVQSNALEVAKEIHRVCRELGIGYFICGGTLLGYVRHGGFIPWDDDMDIGMLRADYQKFLEYAPRIMDMKRFFLQTRESDPSIPYLYSKVRMNGTSYPTEYSRFREFHQGVGVDIFPFDDLPADAAEQRLLLSKAFAAAKRHTSLAFHQYPKKYLKWDPAKRAILPGYARAYAVGSIMARHYNRRSLSITQANYEKLVRQERSSADGSPSEFVGSFVPTYTMARRSDLLPYKKVRFAGVTLMAPANPDSFLSMQYGDYQRIPLPHERFRHGVMDKDCGV